MKRKIELLAPGGDVDAIKAAILAGADAVYCGLDRFNARNKAANISFDDLQGVLRLAHKNDCQVFLTLNIIITENEIPALITLLNKLMNTNIDGIIVQDLGLLYLLNTYFKGFNIHASTQLTTHNEGQILFLSQLNVSRVNLSRELNLKEIKTLTIIAHKNNMLSEVFVHGSNCISFSGICYMSSVDGGKSGNRGRCSQPCRDRYHSTAVGKEYPLNLKDHSAFTDLEELYDAGVDSLKIEGRIKQFDYVYTVVDTWKKQLLRLNNDEQLSNDKAKFYQVFNRDFSNSFLRGSIHKDMYSSHPRDHSIQHLVDINPDVTDTEIEAIKLTWYAKKDDFKTRLENELKQLSTEKLALEIHISGESGKPLQLQVKTANRSFIVFSEINLSKLGTQPLNDEMLLKRLKAINDTEYYIKKLDTQELNSDVYLPFNELTSIKKRLLFLLNDSKDYIEPIDIPVLNKQNHLKIQPELTVFISSPEDACLSITTDAIIYFQLPDGFKNELPSMTVLFKKYEKLIPCFPSVLIGEDYKAAMEFIEEIHPKLIISNNTGIAFEAFKRGIAWIAGPFLNIVNSYSLICLKENFNCSGAYVSNELSKTQLQNLKCPADFKLYYSIFHPIVLMTSRQCLLHQVTACEKECMDEVCIQSCEKTATIRTVKNQIQFIEKTPGKYHRIFYEKHFLNTAILREMPNTFSGFSIDLSDIKTTTKIEQQPTNLIHLFENLLRGKPKAEIELTQNIYPTICDQFAKGI
ncbi:MAG: peptidase U32 family protein [Bacteroidales bacterium]